MRSVIEKKVNEVASEIELRLNNINEEGFSSENALVFNFAWAMKKAFESVLEQVDFETRLFEDFSGGKFLDLLMKFRDSERLYSVGFEFKLPKRKKNSGSGQTNNRVAIIHDLKRLSWLVEEEKIDFGFFVCVTNELGYIKGGNYKKEVDFQVCDGFRYPANSVFPTCKRSEEPIRVREEVLFEWGMNAKGKIVGSTEESWVVLKPILIE